MASEGSVRWEADSVFKRVAFEQPQCGDCLIMGLLGISGLSGLEAFLPSPKDDTYGAVMSEAPLTDTPVLPLTKSWRDADYSMRKNVPSDMTVRSFATRLLLRYSYVMGHVSSKLT